MRSHIFVITSLLSLSCMGRFSAQGLQDESDDPQDIVESGTPLAGLAKQAIVMVIDGTRMEESFGDETTYGEGWSDAYGGLTADVVPTMRDVLLPQGAIVKPGYNSRITITAPAHVDLVTGAARSYGHYPPTDGPGYYRADLPSIFEVIRSQQGATYEQSVMTGNSEHLAEVTWGYYPGLGEEFGGEFVFISEDGNPDKPNGSDIPVIDDVRARLESGARFVVANLHQIDRAGHYNSDQYARYVQDVDAPLSDLWEWIQSDGSGLKDETLMVVVSDHGRHRWDTEAAEPWTNHGCHCSGCREIPMLLLGPGIKAGAVSTTPYEIQDIGQTIAYLMGLDLPYATGRVMTDILVDDSDVVQPSGSTRLVSSDGLLAYQEWTGDDSSRSELLVDEDIISDSTVFHLEEPRVLRTDEADYICWRQLSVGTSDQYWYWEPRCRMRTNGDWLDMGGHDYVVRPFYRPSLAADSSGDLYLAYSADFNSNPAASTSFGVARYTNGNWELGTDTAPELRYPDDTDLLITPDDTIYLAGACSDEESDGRDTRHVKVYQISWPSSGEATWSLSYHSSESDSGAGAYGERFTYGRIEHPALLYLDDTVQLAFHGWSDFGVGVITTSKKDGDSWSSMVTVDASGRVFPHVSPTWSTDGYLYWGRLDEDRVNAEVCRLPAGSTQVSCLSTGAPYLDSLAPSPDGVWASVDFGDSNWTVIELTW